MLRPAPIRHAALGALALLAALPLGASAKERQTGEQQLAELLKGRVAGKPTMCISLINTRGTTVIDGTAIVYDDGSTYYVNRPKYPESLNSDQILVTKTWSDQLCRLDTVELRDRGTRMYDGFVGLEDFVPYTRPPKGATVTPVAAPAKL